MIVSVSRRTDIPAFYSKWFFNRLEEGFVYVINPMNPKQVSKIELNPHTVDCFVFWTKDVTPMLYDLNKLKDYKYYFHYTITSYGKEVETCILDKRKVIDSFKELSRKIGKERVILRYDPIFLSEKYTVDYHIKAFASLCNQLDGFTEKCIISFIDLYKKTKFNTKALHIKPIEITEIETLSKEISKIAHKHGITLEMCSEEYNLSKFGIGKSKCIDDRLISEIIGCEVEVKKDSTQRDICGCVKSVDIGQYNTCRHYCLYCYANFNYAKVEENCRLYKEDNKLLIDTLRDDAKISIRDMKTIKVDKNKQISIFN
ncbi:TPA: DUF1848 domain-containing protein [Clostridioides difficile]|nr:DUF1848 domain-containing protein [Clostridioides difficile]